MVTFNGALTAKATAQATFAGHKVITGFPNHALGVKVELLLNSTWTDITKYVLVRDDITISPFGRTNEASTLDSAQLTITLKNTDGRFTPDNTAGAYYPYVQLNTRIRVYVNDGSVTGVTYSGYRFWGEVSEWPPQWEPTGKDVYCTITASGIWRRLSQRTKTMGSPYSRFNNITGASYNLAGYWPMEDGQGSQYFATTTPSTAGNMTISGPPTNVPTLASVSGFPGSDALPTLNAAEFDATVSTSSNPGTNQLRFCLFVPGGGDTGRGSGVVMRMHTTGTVATLEVSFGSPAAGGPLTITGKNGSGTVLFTSSSTLNIWGIPMLVVANLSQSGGNIVWDLNTMLVGGTTWNTTTTGTLSTATVDDVSSVIVNPGGTFNTVSVGQVALYYGNPGILTTSSALNGWAGENALTRFTRICAEENIPVSTIGTTTTTMGYQSDDTITNVLQEIETTDGGALYETRDSFGLGYRTMASLQNQSSALTLNYAAAQVGQPLNPVNDDAMVRNDITLTNSYDGYSVRVYLANGARSLNDPPNGVGTGYEYAATVNSTSHTQINNLGVQLLNNGTFATSRYPVITANLARTTTAPLFSSIPSLRVGDFFTVSNMPAFGGAATQKQVVWGWNETINHHTWTIAFNTSPEAPWESSFNPGTSFTGQVPATPTTQGGAGGAGTVTSAQIAEGAIIGGNIASGAVQGGNIAAATITATNIASATITGSNIANATITGSNITSGTITGTNIGSATITGANIASATISGTNIATGTIIGGNIGAGTITGSNIASATILGSNIASGTITATNITNATITAAQISSTAGITGSQIAGGTINASNIANATITNVQIAGGTITGSNIGSSTITGANIANATVTSVQISNGTITTTQISNSAGITAGQVGFTAGGISGINTFTAATAPFDWSLSPSTGGTASFVTAATVLAGATPMSVGDTFTDATSARGGPFTVTAISAPSGGNVTVSFTPTASSSILTTDTLHGGTNGSQWYNTGNGNALSVWNNGAWVLSQVGTGAIAANAVTAAQIAANTITAGQIASATITATQIAAGTITGSLIAATTIAAGNIVANTITAAQIAAGTITATQIASSTITATQIAAATITGAKIAAGTITASNITSGTITATQIAANTITASQLAAGIVYAGIVDATTITGASLVADGSNGEILVYAGTPAAGNLIGSWSAAGGTDAQTNVFNAGLWMYDTGGNSMGFVPGGTGAASQLALSTGSGTPTPPSGCAALYGAGSGAVQAVDATDGETYSVSSRRSIVPAVDQNVTSTGFNSWASTTVAANSGAARKYRVHGIAFVAPNQTGGKAGFEWTGPAGISGHLNFQFCAGTSVENSGAVNASVSTGGIVAMTMVSGKEICVTIDGAFSVAAGTSGTFALQAACGTSGDTFIIRAYSFMEVMPV